MKELAELTRIFRVKRVKKMELFDEESLKADDTFIYKLYTGIASGKYKSDKDALENIYNTGGHSKKYIKLKSRLKEKLLTGMFFLDVLRNNESPYHQAYYYCYQHIFLAISLLLNSARNNAVIILKKTLKVALKYQINEAVLVIAKQLRKHYSLLGMEKEYERYNQMAKVTFAILEIEYLSEEYYEEIREKFARSVGYKPEWLSTVGGYLKKLKKHTRSHHSFLLHWNMFRIWIFYLQMNREYKKAMAICKKAENYLKSNTLFSQPVRLAEIALMKMECCLALRDYAKGKACAGQCLELFPDGNINRLVFLEYYFLLAMHTGNYGQAKQIYRDAVNHPHFSSFARERHEKWKIFEAYLYYVISGENEKSAFNLGRFLNEVPIYSKDKNGYNISILTAQVLFLLRGKKTDLIIDKEDALKLYRSHYLNSKEPYNHRSNCFIKMLQLMIHHNFDYEKVVVTTFPYLKELKWLQTLYKSEVETMEVIPFEQLWLFILADLKKLNIVKPLKKESEYSSRALVLQD